MEYLEWNTRLAEHFFSPENAGRKVYLYATRELIESVGRQSGGTFGEFIEAVKRGPEWAHRSGLCQRVLEAMTGWRSRSLPYPPYIASLSLFVIAAGLEGDFEPHEYYGRLWKLLGVDDSGTPPSFDKMLRVWDDLETWSVVDKGGELGVFKAEPVGKWIHVGVPLAQTLLSEEERHALPQIFARTALDPTAPPAGQEIETILRSYGRTTFRAKTLRALVSTDSEQQEVKRALIQTVTNELRNWNGIVPTPEDESGTGGISNWPLRLCCELDSTARRAVMSLRCKAPGEFPEAGFSLTCVGEQSIDGREQRSARFTCEEWQFGWSTPLEDELGSPVDAAQFDWLSGLELEDQTRRWKFRLAPSPVRIFIDGSSDGVGSLIEVRGLPVNRSFYIAASQAACQHISQWGGASCDGWGEVSLLTGLRPGWKLYSATRARSDETIRSKYPTVSLPTFVAVTLRGGIRISRANRYFDFAPPSLEIGGAPDQVTFNGVAVAPRETDGFYDIPRDLPKLLEDDPDKVRIEASCNQRVVDRLTLFLSDQGWSWIDRTIGLKLDAFGNPAGGEPIAFVRGSNVVGFDVPKFTFGGLVPLVSDGSVHYIGREPGQIIHWPNEHVSNSWSPVWVIVSRRSGEVIFCGGDLSECEPLRSMSSHRHKLKLWKDYVWVRRKKLKPPRNPAVSALWKRYQAVAKNV
jgi:hypothetical protein